MKNCPATLAFEMDDVPSPPEIQDSSLKVLFRFYVEKTDGSLYSAYMNPKDNQVHFPLLVYSLIVQRFLTLKLQVIAAKE